MAQALWAAWIYAWEHIGAWILQFVRSAEPCESVAVSAEKVESFRARQSARRWKLDGRAQEIATEHGAERMSLHAAHKAESGTAGANIWAVRPGARAAVSYCSVAAQSQDQSCGTPSHRARGSGSPPSAGALCAGSPNKALERLDPRERRSLENKVRRQVRDMEAARELRAESRRRQIKVNQLDITSAGGQLHAADKKHETNTWKARKLKLAEKQGQKQTRPKRLSAREGRSMTGMGSLKVWHFTKFSCVNAGTFKP